MKRDFNEWLGGFYKSIADYNYYVNFKKVYDNVDDIKIELNILNSLRGSKNIEEDFLNILDKYPECLKCIPILLAVRNNEIIARDKKKQTEYNFKKMTNTKEEYCYFMKETGLFELLEKHIIGNLVDYVTGVETGLDSNARKNRGGHLMEDLVEGYIREAGFVEGKTYFKEMTTKIITKKFGIDLSEISNGNKVVKRFDFVVKTENMIYFIETNFYGSGGSKLNETARSYKNITEEMKKVKEAKFVWFTDGQGWKSAKNNLEETFDVLEDIYCIKELEAGVMKKIFK